MWVLSLHLKCQDDNDFSWYLSVFLCVERSQHFPISSSHLAFFFSFSSFLSVFVCLFLLLFWGHILLHGVNHGDTSLMAETVARCARHMLLEHLAEALACIPMTRSGHMAHNVLQNGGAQLGCHPNDSELSSSWTSCLGTHVCLCWKPQQYHFIQKLCSVMNYSGNVFQNCHWSVQTQRACYNSVCAGPCEESIFSGSWTFQKERGEKERKRKPLCFFSAQ